MPAECPKCHTPIPKHQSYCPNCHTSFRVFEYNILGIAGIFLVIAIFTLIVGLAVPQPRGNERLLPIIISTEIVGAMGLIVLSYFVMKRIKAGKQES